ncbi:hypothetical protein [Pseudomonas sp. p21]|uniref:hypothetical protein n=1 Tax=Pseudomonas sp. p21 TaxID=1825979 RepID=UPI0012E70DC5|nr:hypothetical protein [Pseudomonas sp. p21]
MTSYQNEIEKIRITAGDVFAVPLSTREPLYGHIRAYQDSDIAILPIISRKTLLNAADFAGLTSYQDVLIIRKPMENGEWPKVVNIPFPNEDSAWPPPRKQVSEIRPDIRLVVSKGQFIPANVFGKFDELPPLIKLNSEALIERTLELSEKFKLIKIHDSK